MSSFPPPGAAIRQFIRSESAGGLTLAAAGLLSMIVVNSPLSPGWEYVVHVPLLGLTVERWVNDGLMAIFFLLVGLEIKRELAEGELATWRRRALPGAAAAGGMIAPMMLYLGVNMLSPDTLKGWAIPAATDIAFALGVMSLLGNRVPASLKVFLTALAILDDLGAIGIIALFYNQTLFWDALAGAGLMLFVLVVMNRLHVMRIWYYLPPALAMWWFLQQSGVHAAIAGVAFAACVPVRRWPRTPQAPEAPLHGLERFLQPWVAFLVLPVFAFFNAGIAFDSIRLTDLAGPAPAGVAVGLFLGKQFGVFGACWAAVRFGIAERPTGASWMQIYGVSLLCGIGFTMSLFIGLLAFPRNPEMTAVVKMGVVAGSVLSGAAGAFVLWRAARKSQTRAG